LFIGSTPFGIDEPFGRDLPMKALFDTNGVLDLLLDRGPFSQVLLRAVPLNPLPFKNAAEYFASMPIGFSRLH
jgi:hypothetical protein